MSFAADSRVALDEFRKEPHLSASSIRDYLTCGFLYKLSRIDKVELEGRSEALELGSVIHAVLGEYYETKMEGGKKLSLKTIHSLFTKLWTHAAKESEEIEYAEGRSFKTVLEQGKSLLSAYFENLEDDFRVVAIEQPVRFLVEGIAVVGFLDLIEEDESGTIIITDFKTSSKAYSDDIHKNLQLTIYHTALKANGYSDREILLRIDCLIKTKTPKFQQYYTSRNELDERRLKKKVLKVWDGIQKGVFIPNDGNWKCGYCDYKDFCDAYLESEEEVGM
jgi:putative RecB family exonuclease